MNTITGPMDAKMPNCAQGYRGVSGGGPPGLIAQGDTHLCDVLHDAVDDFSLERAEHNGLVLHREENLAARWQDEAFPDLVHIDYRDDESVAGASGGGAKREQ